MQPVPFVDRDTQVNAILEYAAEAEAGTGRLVLVEGEAGVGSRPSSSTSRPAFPMPPGTGVPCGRTASGRFPGSPAPRPVITPLG